MRLAINPSDSRCGGKAALIDLDNSSRIVSAHASISEARKAKASLLFRADRRYGDPMLKRFPIGTGPEAFQSLAAVNGYQNWNQYSKAEWQEMVTAVRAAVTANYDIDFGEDPILYPPPLDEPDDFDPDAPFNPADFEAEPSGVRTPLAAYSVPVVQALGRPAAGDLEIREPTWWPPASRRY